MKKFFSYAGYLSLLIVALNFTSCQDEFEVIGGDAEEQPITANSSAGKLIENTSTKDGSFDNIVDGASCFDIKFPYTVQVNGLEITIDSREDLHLIEEIFDEVDDDTDFLEILFPITITAGDFTEITINSFEDLRELAAECKEGGGDDDIECIDFVYPMTVFTFDASLEQSGSIVVESDRDLRLFFKGLDDTDFLSFDFPISLKLYDGTTVAVNSNQELARTIEGARDACDEDDDDDYNDDDFDEDDFYEELVECIWFVKEFKRNDIDQTGQYVDYIFNFKEDGTVVTGFRGATTIEGTWSTTVNDDGAKLNLEFDMSVDFNLEWNVYDVGEDRIKLYNGESNRIIMKQICEDDLPQVNPDTLREILKECSWVIKDIELQDVDFYRVLGYEFKFMAEGVVTLGNGINTTEGTWEIKYNEEQKLVMAIEMSDEPGLSFEWPLRDFYSNKLEFESNESGYELELQRVCEDSGNDADVVEFRSLMLGEGWVVASYVDSGEDETMDYAGYSLDFMVENQITINEGTDAFGNGLWRIIRADDEKLKILLNFGENMPFDEFTDDWEVVSVTAQRIELKEQNDDNTFSIVVFEKQ